MTHLFKLKKSISLIIKFGECIIQTNKQGMFLATSPAMFSWGLEGGNTEQTRHVTNCHIFYTCSDDDNSLTDTHVTLS